MTSVNQAEADKTVGAEATRDLELVLGERMLSLDDLSQEERAKILEVALDNLNLREVRGFRQLPVELKWSVKLYASNNKNLPLEMKDHRSSVGKWDVPKEEDILLDNPILERRIQVLELWNRITFDIFFHIHTGEIRRRKDLTGENDDYQLAVGELMTYACLRPANQSPAKDNLVAISANLELGWPLEAGGEGSIRFANICVTPVTTEEIVAGLTPRELGILLHGIKQKLGDTVSSLKVELTVETYCLDNLENLLKRLDY